MFCQHTQAEPWINTSNIYLKANIQLLADTGHIITPVTTYPLMWHDIIRDINKIEINNLTSNQKNAYHYIKDQFKLANSNQIRIKAQTSIKDSRFVTFGDTFRDKNSIQVQFSMIGDNFAAKLSPSFSNSSNDKKNSSLEESYFAAFIGNWVISIGKQDRWYGPTWDTSLSLSNNAHPIPAIALTRKSAEPFTIPFTKVAIPWTVTTFMGKMDDERVVKNTLLWGFRFNLKPFKNLELGITRLAQWGGEDRSHSLSTFGNILIGKTNCGIDGLVCEDNNSNPANQQAGYDLRYSINFFDLPLSFYGQKFAEDGKEGTLQYLTKAQPQLGFDVHLSIFGNPSTVYIEWADSFADCGERDKIGNCYYEHSNYKTGMRYSGRTLGSSYDNDAKTYVLGTISKLNINTHMTARLRYLNLNYDNQDRAPHNPISGNAVTNIAEQVWIISTSIQHDKQNWRYTLGTDISRSTYIDDSPNDIDFNLSLTIEYNL
jgi:hypothetical protein